MAGRPGPGPRRGHDRAATERGQRVLARRCHRPGLAAGPGRRTALRGRGGRRRKTDPDVAPELPEKVVSDRYVQLTREQAVLFEAATADTLVRIGASTGIARRGQVLRLLQSLRQICNSPAHFLRES